MRHRLILLESRSDERAPQLKLVLWNIRWRKWKTRAGRAIQERIWELEPEVVCLTEGHQEAPPGLGGHWITSLPDYRYPIKQQRRKVLMWSRAPWQEVDEIGSPALPGGRFVAGTTDTSIGPCRILGVCIPWRSAHVSTGRKDRAPWDDHLQYLNGLEPIIRRHDGRKPLIVLGDFNQRVPRQRSPQWVFNSLKKSFSGLNWATDGSIPGLDGLSIDHAVHSPTLRSHSRHVLDNGFGEGKTLSDHVGLAVELERS